MAFTLITDPAFYAVAIPAVILTGISKAGFGGAVGSLSVPLMSLAIAPPQAVAIMMPLRLHREIFVGTLAWFFAVVNFSKIGPYAELGLLDWTNLGTALALMPVVPVGYLAGLRFLKAIQPALFIRIATIALLITGLKLLWDAFSRGAAG